MGLTGLEVFKQLPKTNCKDCGYSTCLAFAMALVSGKVDLESCPHVSDAAKEILGSASAPPMATIKIGTGDQEFTAGGETVLFRHDKRFEHPTGIAVAVSDTGENLVALVKARVNEINKLVFERIGQTHHVDLVAVKNDSGDAGKFAVAVQAAQDSTPLPLLLMTEDPLAAGKALEVCAAGKPLLYGATSKNFKMMTELAQKYKLVLGVKGKDLNDLAALVEKIHGLGHKQLVIDSGSCEPGHILADQTQIRRQALRKFRPFGYPTLVVVENDDPIQAAADASVYISKYAGIVVYPAVDPAEILPLITLRLNIYTDPQKPIAVEPKVYEVGTPDENSPVFVTTNFSLSYFCLQGDIETAKVSSYILSVDTDGTSVLTGWAAGKFTPEKINDMLNTSGLADKVNHKTIIIPGGVAVLGERLEKLSGWRVLVGPSESAGIPGFIKQLQNSGH